MELSYEVRTHGLPGTYRWRIEVRPTEPVDEHGRRPLLADIIQPGYEPWYVSPEAAERGGEAFLELVAGSPPRA